MNIHDQALEIVAKYKKAESELIDIINKIDLGKSYFDKNLNSTYEYCTRFLNLSESTAYDFISVARKSRAIPQLKEAIDENRITVSKARRIASVITTQNSVQWIEMAENLSKGKLEKEIAKVNPGAAVTEKVKYVTADRLKLELGVSEEFMKILKRVQDLESQRTATAAKFEATIEKTLRDYLERHDPVEKAKRAKLGPGQVDGPIPFMRYALDATTKHQIQIRDQGRCTHISNGNRCSHQRWLQVHHIIPISQGGQNNIENLTTLCSAHHKLKHFK